VAQLEPALAGLAIDRQRLLEVFGVLPAVQVSTELLAEAIRPHNPQLAVFANALDALPPPRPPLAAHPARRFTPPAATPPIARCWAPATSPSRLWPLLPATNPRKSRSLWERRAAFAARLLERVSGLGDQEGVERMRRRRRRLQAVAAARAVSGRGAGTEVVARGLATAKERV